MGHMKEGLFLKFLLRTFDHIVVFILLIHLCGGQSQRVMTMVGDDVVLPCQLKPPTDAAPMILEWGRPDLNPRFVFVWHNGQELLVDQNKAYKGRTSLSIDKLKRGDISLKISKVKISDEGTYRCYIPKLYKEYFVELVVGAVSSPGISLVGIDRSSSGVILQCESKCWNPEPEMFWLDGEGNLLSAGPTETVRGPDDLYTVSSRVTVEKRHNNNFTCRVQQKNINQTRETYIHVPDDFFMAPSSCAAFVTTSVLFAFMFILVVVIFVLKWRQHKHEQRLLKEGEDTRVQLTESKKMVDLEKEKAKLNEELQKEAEEQKHLEQQIDKLKEHKKELLNQKGQITVQEEKTMKLMEENETKSNSVEKEISEKEGDKTVNRAQGYLKLKEIIKAINWSLDERKQEEQKVGVAIDKVMKMTDIEVLRMTNKNKQLQSHVEEINEQLEKINRQQDEIQEKLKSETKEKKEDNKTNLLTHDQVI
ncbi:butyrophilin subfamily 2 member A2-like [Thunnus albacares]|uniref:butyrophilin subfamily 2 member A2-like n=1 Tax=Thunnus albacares TaxID=8236 RepID=UPI001CF6110A|nr:butyrophilin subfamily 2 member A2-like [Thunnus albacares]